MSAASGNPEEEGDGGDEMKRVEDDFNPLIHTEWINTSLLPSSFQNPLLKCFALQVYSLCMIGLQQSV